jgi:CRP/FNR family transcriptional regulator
MTGSRTRHAKSKIAGAPLLPHANVLALMTKRDHSDLNSLAQLQSFKKGDLLFHAGAPSRHVYFLRSGRIKIYQPCPCGKEVILWFCFPGDMFGFAEVVQGEGRVVNAVACETSEVLSITQAQFADFLQTHPAASLLVMQALSCRLRALGEFVVNLVNDDVQTRIMKLILRLRASRGVRDAQDVQLDIALTHQEIADMVGATRQTVTSILSDLQRRGLLRQEHRRIHIERPELLKVIANPA